MATYLVDFENVRNEGLVGIQNLKSTDEVLIFYTINANSIEIDMIIDIKAKLRFIKVECGTPNALDFQLVAHLFYNVDKRKRYVIVALDKGYDVVVRRAGELGCKVSRKGSIESDISNQPKIKPVIETLPEDTTQISAIDNRTYDEKDSKLQKVVNVCDLYGMNPVDYCGNPDKKRVDMKLVPTCKENPYKGILKDGEDKVWETLNVMAGVSPTEKGLRLVIAGLVACNSREEFYKFCVGRFGSTVGCGFYNSVKARFEPMKNIARSIS